MAEYQEYHLDGVSPKEFLKEICYSSRHHELADIILKMRMGEPREDSNRLLDLFIRLSDDLFQLYKMMN